MMGNGESISEGDSCIEETMKKNYFPFVDKTDTRLAVIKRYL